MLGTPCYQFFSRKQREQSTGRRKNWCSMCWNPAVSQTSNTIIGVIQDLEGVVGRVSEDQ